MRMTIQHLLLVTLICSIWIGTWREFGTHVTIFLTIYIPLGISLMALTDRLQGFLSLLAAVSLGVAYGAVGTVVFVVEEGIPVRLHDFTHFVTTGASLGVFAWAFTRIRYNK